MGCVWMPAVVFADLSPSPPLLRSAKSAEQPSKNCDYFVSELLGQLCLPKDLYCLDGLPLYAWLRSFPTTDAGQMDSVEFGRRHCETAGVFAQLISLTSTRDAAVLLSE